MHLEINWYLVREDKAAKPFMTFETVFCKASSKNHPREQTVVPQQGKKIKLWNKVRIQ
jgi:hypothetical protein